MLIEKIKEIGFDNVAEIDVAEIGFEPSLISLCEKNTCGNYGRNYACPPLLGKTEDLIKKAKSFKKMILFQKIYQLEDSFDIEGMARGKMDFSEKTIKTFDAISDIPNEHMVLGAGGCTLCKECGAITNTPCRFPDRAIPSLESFSIQVSTLAGQCGMKYINGVNTTTYFGAVLYK